MRIYLCPMKSSSISNLVGMLRWWSFAKRLCTKPLSYLWKKKDLLLVYNRLKHDHCLLMWRFQCNVEKNKKIMKCLFVLDKFMFSNNTIAIIYAPPPNKWCDQKIWIVHFIHIGDKIIAPAWLVTKSKHNWTSNVVHVLFLKEREKLN